MDETRKDDALLSAFGHELTEARERAGLTLEQLSERSGVSVASLFRYEHGTREITLGKLRRVAAALDVLPEQLVEAGRLYAAFRADPAEDPSDPVTEGDG